MSTDLGAFVSLLRAERQFQRGARISVARAPGRLDVMGGIADYSGSLVLERPIAEATFAAVERIDEPVLQIVSLGRTPCTIPIASLVTDGVPVSYEDARRMFGCGLKERRQGVPGDREERREGVPGDREERREGVPGDRKERRQGVPVDSDRWIAYVAGVIVVLARERGMPLTGMRIVISSRVPEGKGVSSSAAVETATMQAVACAFGIELPPRLLALLCQKAENLVAGAPCGVMDQMTCVLGEAQALLALLCQPAEAQPLVPIPDGIEFWGLDSGERHAVTGSDYGTVRAGAFMGLRMLSDHASVPGNYLANIEPSEFARELASHLPEEMSGDEFLRRYGGTSDTLTTVEPQRRYPVRAATAYPIHERDRAENFRTLLLEAVDEERLVRLGALMYESHAGYGACGLGSPGTDRLVGLVRAAGPGAGLYGARITGGGCGGTVAVIGRRDASPAIARVVEAYAQETAYRPHVFAGGSPGVAAFGCRSITV
jgi:galactokinase